jgi:DNA-binding MarR family transcriptional regulator
MGKNPARRNGIEIRVLNRLYDRGRSVSLSDLRDLIPLQGETIINSLFTMEKESLVTITGEPGEQRVSITESGKSELALIEAEAKDDNGI